MLKFEYWNLRIGIVRTGTYGKLMKAIARLLISYLLRNFVALRSTLSLLVSESLVSESIDPPFKPFFLRL